MGSRSHDAYNETLEKEQKRESEVQNMKDRYDNIKNLSDDDVVNILQNWLSKCDVMRTLDFNMQYLIKQNTRNSKRHRYLPISFNKLNSENQGLYNVIIERQK